MRHTPSASDQALLTILDPRRLLRWIYVGRMTIASAIFVAAVYAWMQVSPASTLLASVAIAVTAGVTIVSAGYSSVNRARLSTTFLYLQSIFDVVLVTVIVHITNTWQRGNGVSQPAIEGTQTQFSALYIIVIATSTLLLPRRGAWLIACLADVLYLADGLQYFQATTRDPWLWAQLALFALVALGTALLSEELRRGGEGTALLAARLEHVRLRAEDVLRNINSGVITIDPSGRLVYANPMAEHLLGISLASQTNHVVIDQIKSESPELGDMLERCARERSRTTRAECLVVTNGREFPIGVTTTFMEDPSGNVAATAIFQDISDSKRMESLRMRAERLEGIAELSASLAHEIKNPLASIRSSVEQISKMPHPGEDERILSTLVMRESDRLSRLLTEFLDFARVRVARHDLLDIGAVAEGATRLAQAHPDRKDGVRVECLVPDGPRVFIHGDEDMLHRAIFNLALNAVQASPADAAVTIEVLTAADDRVLRNEAFRFGAIGIRVTDRGSGIPPEIRSRLFDPFTTTKPQGTGLGLAVVQRAVEAHKGLVLVDSAGQGTTVTVVLPRLAADAPVPAMA